MERKINYFIYLFILFYIYPLAPIPRCKKTAISILSWNIAMYYQIAIRLYVYSVCFGIFSHYFNSARLHFRCPFHVYVKFNSFFSVTQVS